MATVNVLGSDTSTKAIGVLIISYNGKKEKIKVYSQSTTLREMLEMACQKYSLTNANLYQLVHRKKVMDLSLPFRFTGLNNNATLDLVRKSSSSSGGGSKSSSSSSKDNDSMVNIQVRLSGGSTHRGKYSSSTTLEDIVKDIHAKGVTVNKIDSMVYMRQKVDQQQFSSTSLISLGLSSGSASFRASENNNNNNGEGEKKEQNEQKKQEIKEGVAAAPVAVVPTPPSPPNNNTFPDELKEKFKSIMWDEDSRIAIPTLCKIFSAILQNPKNDRVKQLKMSNQTFYDRVGRFPVAVEILLSAGFVNNNDVYIYENVDNNTLENHIDGLEKLARDLNLSNIEDIIRINNKRKWSEQQNNTQQQQQQDEPIEFDPYKSNVVRINPQPRGGKSKIETELNNLQEKYDSLVLKAGIPERDVKIFQASDSFNARKFNSDNNMVIDEQPRGDSALVLQATKAMQEKQKQKSKFSTKAMRDLEQLKKAKVFTKTLLRVQFPDRYIIQATFSPVECVGELYELINSKLEEPFQNKFELYVSPPKQTLAKEDTFQKLQLIPAALIFVKWKPILEQQPKDYILLRYRENKSHDNVHNEFPSSIPIVDTKTQTTGSISSTQQQQSSSSLSSSAKKTLSSKPKWMKL